MVFSSLVFLFRFLPIALVVYFLTPRFLKNGVLFVISLIFYAWGEPRYIVVMLISVIADYIISNIMEKKEDEKVRKGLLLLSMLISLGLLMTFKYLDFFIANINRIPSLSLPYLNLTLPLGISFYTFQTMSYTIDVYRKKIKAEKSFINFAAYVSLFPQLIAGPIVKYEQISKELKEREINLEQINTGVRYFILGMASKVLLANNLGLLWDDVQILGIERISTPLAWLGILAYSLQIYFDFSGYSLMAIGLGKILGFEFPKNFDFPYMSRSITEFWRRWHMTLGNWFREYVYIPLGGNREGLAKQIRNILIVWFLTGFWHGASWNFIIWGLYFAFFLIVEKLFLLEILDKKLFISHIYSKIIILFSWMIFALDDMGLVKEYFLKLISFEGGSDWIYALSNYGTTFILAFIFATPWIKNIHEKYGQKKFVTEIFLLILFILSVAYLTNSSFNPFLYFRF